MVAVESMTMTCLPWNDLLSFSIVVMVTLASLMSGIDANLCPAMMPHNCTCTGDQEHQVYSVTCLRTGLTSVPDDLPHLLEMRFKFNNIVTLGNVPYSSLKALHLDNNNIRVIDAGAFTELRDLETLSMTYNGITELGRETFSGLRSLTQLHLRGNPLYEIGSNVFSGHTLPQIDTLDVSACRIYEVSPTAFDIHSPLAYLNISRNRLTTLEFIKPLPNIRTLDVSLNRIKELTRFPSPRRSSLDDLVLSYNELTSIGHSTFEGLTRLSKLHLRGNLISDIHQLAFRNTPSLTDLDLSDNRLESLPRNALPFGLTNKLRVTNNPWNCHCQTVWLRSKEILKWNLGRNLTCAKPSQVFGMAVYDTNMSFFRCDPLPSQPSPRTLAIGLGVILGLLIALLAGLLLYRLVLKKRRGCNSRDSIMAVSTSSAYSRVRDSRELVLKDEDI